MIKPTNELISPFKVVLGVDRLDYTKGIVHRIRAFEKLLDTYPEHKEQVFTYQYLIYIPRSHSASAGA